jgi:DNA ligase-1
VLRFAQTCERIGATASRLAKIDALADYFRSLDDADLSAATRFFTGSPFAPTEGRTLSVGGRTIVAAADAVWQLPDGALGNAYRDAGDLGAALGTLMREPAGLSLFRDTLAPATLKTLLDEIADAQGKAANKRRQYVCERIFAACASPLEATFVIKILTGDLRIGLREGLVLDAIAAAFARDADDVRKAAMAAGDVGAVAIAAKHDTLGAVEVAYGTPIGFMLASPIPYGGAYAEFADGGWIVEDKYDGIRVQAHKRGDRVALFSRTHTDIGNAFPEIVAALRATAGDAILDGEIVAVRDDRVLPFRDLQTRLQRKDPSLDLQREIPVRFVVFDMLARGGTFVLDVPLVERRGLLAETVAATDDRVTIAPWSALETGAQAEIVHARFDDARARGNEGLMFKRTDAPYAPGRRGKWWLKLKRELSTLDCVVVAVEWGHGKRAKWLSDYTFAVRDGDDLLVIGKAYTGLTDAEIVANTDWFLARRLPDDEAQTAAHTLDLKRHEIVVEPTMVIEVAFDIIQKSTLHKSGYALRFPRIVRVRDDKAPRDADTLARLEEVYAEMLAREAGTPTADV